MALRDCEPGAMVRFVATVTRTPGAHTAPELVANYLLTVRRELDCAADCLSLPRRESVALAAGDEERCVVLDADRVVRGTVAACWPTRNTATTNMAPAASCKARQANTKKTVASRPPVTTNP